MNERNIHSDSTAEKHPFATAEATGTGSSHDLKCCVNDITNLKRVIMCLSHISVGHVESRAKYGIAV